MERGFYNEDIEELLKEKADQYKMYPSDKVWKGIHRSLHPNRKWYWLSLILFLSAVGYYTFIEFIAPSSSNKIVSGANPTTPASSKPSDATASDAASPKAVIVPFGTPGKQNGSVAGNNSRQRTFILNPDNNNGTDKESLAIVPELNHSVVSNDPAQNNTSEQINTNAIASTIEAPVYDLKTGRPKKTWQQPAPTDNIPFIADIEESPLPSSGKESLTNSASVDQNELGSNKKNAEEDNKRLNWIQNLAVYELNVPKQKRLSWQLAFTPTMNYRTWKGSNNAADVKTLPLQPIIEGDPDKLVNHKPALGFELGSNILYAINKNITLRTGLLFNYTRYDIQAYSSYASDRAVIALNTSYGIAMNEITTYTRYRNFGGDAVQNLHNQYFQLSVPLGMEVNLFGNGKLQVGVAGSLQPTYLLNRNEYLLTADYKYTTEPTLLRKWNINSSAAAFVSYKTGELKWSVGPQFRYQLLSSYIKEYPIREHLFEYGIQIGVAKTIR
ncbi:MAG TPA: hypothetical protein VIM79_24865 [Niastella sp.]